MTQTNLLDHLEIEVRDLLERVRTEFANLPQNALNQRVNLKSWTALECFAHLNAVSDNYLPVIELAIHKSKARRWTPVEVVKSSWPGSAAVRRVDPANRTSSRKKSLKRFNFIGKPIRDNEVKVFLINHERLLRILRMAREVDLNRTRVPFSNLIFFKWWLTDLFQHQILHAKRHVEQASEAAGAQVFAFQQH